MRWTTAATTGLLAAALAGCGPGGNRQGAETGAAGDTAGTGMTAMPSDTAASGGAMTGGGSGSDTAMTGMSRDSGTPGMSRDTGSAPGASADSGRSISGNQSESGVTNTETKRSTLGPGATKTRPDQGQPVTSKGDTVNRGVDSTAR